MACWGGFALRIALTKDFLGRQMAILDRVIAASIQDNQNSNAIGALRLQAELTRLLGK